MDYVKGMHSMLFIA